MRKGKSQFKQSDFLKVIALFKSTAIILLGLLTIFFSKPTCGVSFVNLCTDSNSLPEPCCDGSGQDSSYYLMPPNTVDQNVGFCENEPGARFVETLKTLAEI